jgi:hypothetical protein
LTEREERLGEGRQQGIYNTGPAGIEMKDERGKMKEARKDVSAGKKPERERERERRGRRGRREDRLPER